MRVDSIDASEAGVAQLMARRSFQPSPGPGGLEDLVDAIGGHRLAAVRALQGDEHPIRLRSSWPFVTEVVTDRGEERVGDRDHVGGRPCPQR
jgi:hypothetical protein